MSNSYLKTSTRSIIKYCNKAVNQIKLTHLLEVLGFYTRDRYSTRPGSLMRLWSQNGPYVSSELQGNPLQINVYDTVDGRNPGNQLRLVVYPIIYRVLYHKQYDILHTSTIIYLSTYSLSSTWVLSFAIRPLCSALDQRSSRYWLQLSFPWDWRCQSLILQEWNNEHFR